MRKDTYGKKPHDMFRKFRAKTEIKKQLSKKTKLPTKFQ